jgi:hypothetical protein
MNKEVGMKAGRLFTLRDLTSFCSVSEVNEFVVWQRGGDTSFSNHTEISPEAAYRFVCRHAQKLEIGLARKVVRAAEKWLKFVVMDDSSGVWERRETVSTLFEASCIIGGIRARGYFDGDLAVVPERTAARIEGTDENEFHRF